ncbi:MAG: prephenate dehydratase [Candidatus Bathyarchaeota archaeon]|nr:prephenate dehydratase [Candidatus Bathyarchaeota archaeon]
MKPTGNRQVAFQGERGAFSEGALLRFFGSSVNPMPCRSFSEVFEKVEVNQLEFGVVPIENSIEGSVNQVYDLLLEHDLLVCGEVVEKIVHCLVVNPSTELKSIKTVCSHPQALAQCRDFWDSLGWDAVSTFDTAGAVRQLKETRNLEGAAIASEQAAEIHKMKILARNIADNPENFTRFLVLSKTDVPFRTDTKTSIIFSARHIPGALYDVLKEFAEGEINLTKIESRPTKKEPWKYNFYLDFEGHREDPKCLEVLKKLERKCTMVKLLGSYSKADAREFHPTQS